MTSYLYRYRSARQVLEGFSELQNEEIYFSPPVDLNDPVEGFKDLYWSGDEIVWQNLLKHYVLCLLYIAHAAFLGEADGGRAVLRNAVFSVPEELPDIPLRTIYFRATEAFLGERVVEKFIQTMAARTVPVRRNELTHYLRMLHAFLLKVVLNEFEKNGVPLSPKFVAAPIPERLRRNALALIESFSRILVSKNLNSDTAEALFTASEAAATQLDLISEYELMDREPNRPLMFFCRYFPSAYVTALEQLVHPNWYAASFSANPVNSLMWGAYADGHRGFCLKFKAPHDQSGTALMMIRRVTGIGGSDDRKNYHWTFAPVPFQKIQYAPAFPRIDFFRSLGRVRTIDLNRFWHTDGKSLSRCRIPSGGDEQAWRQEYWRMFSAGFLYKTPEWKHEEEYRLVLHSSAFDLADKRMRTLRYRFEDLAGIIFGARTAMEDKLAVMKIIDRKCSALRRTDFEFSEIRYMPGTSSFQLAPLSLVKLKHE